MSDRLWKKTERAIAKRLGGQRVGATGKPGPDVVTSTLSVEVKTRKTLPKWLKDALAQATNGADGRLPVVIIHQAGERHADDLVLVRMGDFEDWFGEVTNDR